MLDDSWGKLHQWKPLISEKLTSDWVIKWRQDQLIPEIILIQSSNDYNLVISASRLSILSVNIRGQSSNDSLFFDYTAKLNTFLWVVCHISELFGDKIKIGILLLTWQALVLKKNIEDFAAPYLKPLIL